MNRVHLTPQTDASAFLQCYWLKEELAAFCRENGLPASGSKEVLTARIAQFLTDGTVCRTQPKRSRGSENPPQILTESAQIEANCVCSERHRAFFREKIGKSFTFNTAFQKWLKANAGKTYADAIRAYYDILAEKKARKTEIGAQFEYNTYIRDFFAANRGKTLADAIRCWKAKKQQAGSHRYEPADLAALNTEANDADI